MELIILKNKMTIEIPTFNCRIRRRPIGFNEIKYQRLMNKLYNDKITKENE